jgi:hypothetical protein
MPLRNLICCALFVGLIACKSQEQASAPPPLPGAPSASSAALSDESIVLTTSQGGSALTIAIHGDTLDVDAYGQHVVGKLKGEKRYYHQSAGGAPFVEVKNGDDGFKVRTPDSQLLWKIKIGDDKIKLSDNEENKSPWLLKSKHDDKTKVLDPNEAEIGLVKHSADTGKTKIKDAQGNERFVVTSGRASGAYGVLLMSGVPEQYRGVIIAELVVRGH